MKQFIVLATLLLASVATTQAAKSVIGKPTGKVDERKRRHLERKLEKTLKQKQEDLNGQRGANSDRNLQGIYGGGYQGSYAGQMPPGDYYPQGGAYYPPQGGAYYPPQGAYYPQGAYPQGGAYYPQGAAFNSAPKWGGGSGKGKGMGIGKGKSKSMGKKGAGKKGPGGGGRPVVPLPPQPIPDCRFDKTLVQNPFNDVWEYICDDDDCEMLITSEEYVFLSADAVIVPEGGNTTDIGAVFVWSAQNLLDPTTLDPNNPLDASISGTCTRTSEGGDMSAMGYCSWTLVNLSGDQLTIAGVLGSSGTNMVITGGSGTFAGMIGDAVTIPYAIGNGDIFEDAQWYEGTLTIGYIVCPAQLASDIQS